MNAERLLARARTYQALALGYDYPAPAQRARLTALLDEPARWASVLGEAWPALLADLGSQARTAAQDAVERDFNRLFSGTVECSPHETSYEPDVFARQRALADLAGFYQAFGFGLGEPSRWQPDHVGVELEFAAIVLQRHAAALVEGWDEPARVCDEALRAFLLDHTGRWHAAFSRHLGRLAATPLYRTLAEVTGRWIDRELRAFRLHPRPLADRPRSAVDDDTPPACGTCPVAPVQGR